MMKWRRARDLAPTLAGGLLAGVLAGLLLGRVLAGILPGTAFDAGQGERLRADYLLLIATVYAADGDLPEAWRRLRQVAAGGGVAWLQDVTERFIVNSRDVQDIRHLVALAEGLGRLTPAMGPFRQRDPAASAP